MKTIRVERCILIIFLALYGNSSYAQNGLGARTTFEDLYASSDFIGWIKIVDQRHEMIPARREDGKKANTIAIINTFKALDEIKRTSGTPNQFVSMGGDYPADHPYHGQTVYQTSEVYFEIGDEIFVHLGKNDLLFDKFQILGVNPGGRAGSVFLIDDSGAKRQIVPYSASESFQSDTDRESRASITPQENVVSTHPRSIDYVQLKSMYNDLGTGSKEGSE